MAMKNLTGAGALSSQVALARFFNICRQHVREVNAAVRLDPEGPWPWEHIWAAFGFAPETDKEIEELQEPLLRPKAIQHATG